MNDFIKEMSSMHSDYLYQGEGFSNKLPTGIITLDIALGGGVPLNGSIIEIYGEESHGKTTLSYRLCRKCTSVENGYVTWVDSETSYEPEWARIQGLNLDRVIPYRPPYAEAAMNIIIDDIRIYKEKYLPWLVDPKWRPSKIDAANAGLGVSDVEGIKQYMKSVAPPHMIVWDSLAASPVKSVAEEGASFSEGMAYRARLIKMFLSRYNVAVVGCDNIGMILINQVIDKIGSYGGGVTTPGGRGLRHGKHLALYVKKSGSGEKDAENFRLTDYVYISITKNKVTPVISSFPVVFSKSKGYIGATSLLEYLLLIGWFRNAGSWKKFDYVEYDKPTGEVLHEEEISIQRGTFYDMIEKRPEIFRYLCEQVKSLFLERFPTNKNLQDTDISSIIEACFMEETAVPDEDEVASMSGDTVQKKESSNLEDLLDLDIEE